MDWIACKNNAIFSVENKIIGEANWVENATAIFEENGFNLDMLHSTRVQKDSIKMISQ